MTNLRKHTPSLSLGSKSPQQSTGVASVSEKTRATAGISPAGEQVVRARQATSKHKHPSEPEPPIVPGPQKKYGLFTALAMIIGICIGSGIFFKSDNVLTATGGDIGLGVLVFCLAAIAIVFGGITMSELAARTDGAGGFISYAETFIGPRFGAAVGWFTIFGYLPATVVIVSWAVGIYTCILFNIDAEINGQMLIGVVFMVVCFTWNTIAPRFAGAFQNITTVIKLMPLIVVAICGLVFGDPVAGFSQHGDGAAIASFTWIAAVGPIAFAYDGWICAASIAPELKDAKRSLPIALTVAPLIILLVYIGYFVGVTTYLGPQTVMDMGDGHVFYLASQLFGPAFARVIAVTVVIAVMGTVNGLTLSYVRMPHALALSGDIPFSRLLTRMSPRFNMPIASGVFAFIVSLVWVVFHLVTQQINLLPNSDISEVTIATSYLLYFVLYVKVFRMWRAKEVRSVFKGCIAPIFAGLGSLFICIGSMQNPAFWFCLAASLALCVVGVVYDRRKRTRSA